MTAQVAMDSQVVERQPAKLAWTWWSGLIDAFIISAVALFIVITVGQAVRPVLVRLMLLPKGGTEYFFAHYWFNATSWMILESWLLVRWVFWKGAWKQIMPFGPLAIPLQTAIAWSIIAFAIILLVHVAVAIGFPESTGQDALLYAEWLKSAMAPTLLFTGIVVAPVTEELLFRGFLLSIFSKSRLGFWGAAVVVSLIWGLLHNYSWPSTLTIAIAGLIHSFLLRKTGSLVPCMIVHGSLNYVAFLVEAAAG